MQYPVTSFVFNQFHQHETHFDNAFIVYDITIQILFGKLFENTTLSLAFGTHWIRGTHVRRFECHEHFDWFVQIWLGAVWYVDVVPANRKYYVYHFWYEKIGHLKHYKITALKCHANRHVLMSWN